MRVESERDRVVLAFGSRGRDLCLSPDAAERLAEGMERAAGYCERWTAAGGRGELVRGESRGALVKSWDGRVNVRFDGITDRESIPFAAARLLAAEIRAKVPEARERMSIAWRPNLIGV
jgi:hypothetical protein